MNNDQRNNNLAAIVLAAGRSVRFGQPKLLMPWKNSTVIQHVIQTLQQAGVRNIHVVINADDGKLLELLSRYGVEWKSIDASEEPSMLLSLQTGINSLIGKADHAMIVLGDQPTITIPLITALTRRISLSKKYIIVPTFNGHKGHPWIVHHDLWQEILDLRNPMTARDFLNVHASDIDLVNYDSSILDDFDTPAEYEKLKNSKP